jgi:hypothetical protein
MEIKKKKKMNQDTKVTLSSRVAPTLKYKLIRSAGEAGLSLSEYVEFRLAYLEEIEAQKGQEPVASSRSLASEKIDKGGSVPQSLSQTELIEEKHLPKKKSTWLVSKKETPDYDNFQDPFKLFFC